MPNGFDRLQDTTPPAPRKSDKPVAPANDKDQAAANAARTRKRLGVMDPFSGNWAKYNPTPVSKA